ncbi:hypothetical protein Dimus_024844 [Dionaea muscipula]
MAENPNCTIYIGNLDERVSDRVLYDILIQAGRVLDLHIPRDKESNKPKGFAFAEYESREIADYAVRLFSGLVTLYNRTLKFAALDDGTIIRISVLFLGLPQSAPVSPSGFGFDHLRNSRLEVAVVTNCFWLSRDCRPGGLLYDEFFLASSGQHCRSSSLILHCHAFPFAACRKATAVTRYFEAIDKEWKSQLITTTRTTWSIVYSVVEGDWQYVAHEILTKEENGNGTKSEKSGMVSAMTLLLIARLNPKA